MYVLICFIANSIQSRTTGKRDPWLNCMIKLVLSVAQNGLDYWLMWESEDSLKHQSPPSAFFKQGSSVGLLLYTRNQQNCKLPGCVTNLSCQLHTTGKRGPLLRSCFHHIPLWVCLQTHFITDCSRRGQHTVGLLFLDWLRKLVKHEPESKQQAGFSMVPASVPASKLLPWVATSASLNDGLQSVSK